MTNTAVTLSANATLIDFSSPATMVYGQNSRIESNGIAMMWGGEHNRNESVTAYGPNNDLSPLMASVIGSEQNPSNNINYRLYGYHLGDFNLDGVALYAGPENDTNLVISNVLLHPNNVTLSANFILQGQIPKQ